MKGKSIIVFNSVEWNSLLALVGMNPKYPFIRIHKNHVMATDGKVVISRTLKRDVTNKSIFINKKDMAKLIDSSNGKNPKIVVKIRIMGKKVHIKYPNKIVKEITYAFDPIKFPKIKNLKERMEGDKKITFCVTRNTLEKLLLVTTSKFITITVCKNSIVGRIKTNNVVGFFAQAKIEKE